MTNNFPSPVQSVLFPRPFPRYICTYRVALVRDHDLPFEQQRPMNSRQACPIIRKLIETYGQSDREQFCVILLNTKNEPIGINIVSTGSVSSSQVHPREALKPVILTGASAVIFCHNHPSGDVTPSPEDLVLRDRLVKACQLVDIKVHEHLIISMFDDRYYSFADSGVVNKFYEQQKE